MIVDRIHWLASFPKSGNTWVRSFLSAYRFGVLELNRMDFVSSDNKPGIFQLLLPTPVENIDLSTWARLRASALRLMMNGAQYDPLILKTHNANAEVNGFPLFPDKHTGPSVYLIRDPRDVATSYASHMGTDCRSAIEQMASAKLAILDPDRAEFLPSYLSSWALHVTHWVKRPDVIVVRYEDLLADPHRDFRRILVHFGIEYDDGRFNRALDASQFKRMKQAEDSLQTRGFAENSRQQDRFFRTGMAGKWRERLTRKQIRTVDAAMGTTMARFGYERCGRMAA